MPLNGSSPVRWLANAPSRYLPARFGAAVGAVIGERRHLGRSERSCDRLPPLSAMGKSLNAGRVLALLQGRYAGRNAVIVKVFGDGSAAWPFGHCLVACVDRPPPP